MSDVDKHRLKPIDQTRRKLLGGLGSLAGLSALRPAALLAASDDGTGAGTAGRAASAKDEPQQAVDVDFRLSAEPDTTPILPGTPSEVWRYKAALITGPQDTLTPVGKGFVGPLIRLRRGQRVRARLENRLSEDTTVHWHGLHVPPDVDGQPRLPIKPGESMTVAFDVDDRAGLYWYHPHPHGPDGGRVGFQSYAGLAGPLVIEDETERALDLPDGEQEMVLVLQDRSFAGDNELTYLGGAGSMMTRMRGFLGDRVLVNGRPPETREVGTRPHRLRILNGSNSRIYKLAWSDDRPVTVLGTDGGLLAAPEKYPYVTLAPAQRIDLWVDLSAAGIGDQLTLVSDHYRAGTMAGGSNLPAGARFDLVTLRMARRERGVQQLPKVLDNRPTTPSVSPDTPTRTFELTMKMMRGFAINGRQFEGATVADDEIVRLGDTEIWEFVNTSMMPHPMHVHGLQFAVVDREQIGGSRYWNGLNAGLVDTGRHDTVLALPGERVRIALTFTDFEGFYLYHCHNMEHEDNGMMRYYRVRA
ncbi:multicopper oxidase family protein [Salinisphaera orenii]|uniref:multicopper oxidase family protein n=1 Tax=Salinisphaera orenii TaxID=856731 RepID=UPI000DBE6111